MAAIARIVAGIGGSTVLDLNDTSGGGQLIGSGALELADTDPVDDALGRWEASTAPVAVATRKINVPVVLVGSSVDNLATKVSALHQAVQVPWWLQVRRSGGTQDSYLRCYPAVPKMTARVTGSSANNVATAVLVADTEPYAYGARVDAGPFTVVQDTSSAGACYFDVTGVAGDTVTPTVIRTATADLLSQHATLLAVRRHGTPSGLPTLFLQGEAATLTAVGGTITMSTPSDATLAGASGARTAFSSGYTGYPSDRGVVRWLTTGWSGAEMPGTYRVLARVKRSSAADAYYLSAGLGPASIGVTYLPAGSTTTGIVDLGLVQIPLGSYQQIGAPGGLLPAAAPGIMGISVYKSAPGAGTLDLDWVGLIPADEDAGMAYGLNVTPNTSRTLTVDGYTDTAFLHSADPITSAGSAQTATSTDGPVGYIGGVPRLAPGTNRVYLLTGLFQSKAVTAPPMSTSPVVNLSYWPRYTWLR